MMGGKGGGFTLKPWMKHSNSVFFIVHTHHPSVYDGWKSNAGSGKSRWGERMYM